MLIVNYKNPNGVYAEFCWNVGMERFTVVTTASVTSVYADGHELEGIRMRFNNLPICTEIHCQWHGEMAKFIFSNLFNKQ